MFLPGIIGVMMLILHLELEALKPTQSLTIIESPSPAAICAGVVAQEVEATPPAFLSTSWLLSTAVQDAWETGTPQQDGRGSHGRVEPL